MSSKKPPEMSREEFLEIVRTQLGTIKSGAKLLGNLAESLSKSTETSTTAFQDACELLHDIDRVKTATRIVRDTLDRRASAQKNEIRRGEYDRVLGQKPNGSEIRDPMRVLGGAK
jgi:hypothetical protein